MEQVTISNKNILARAPNVDSLKSDLTQPIVNVKFKITINERSVTYTGKFRFKRLFSARQIIHEYENDHYIDGPIHVRHK